MVCQYPPPVGLNLGVTSSARAGVRRKQLGAKIQLQSQQVTRAQADAIARCARTVANRTVSGTAATRRSSRLAATTKVLVVPYQALPCRRVAAIQA